MHKNETSILKNVDVAILVTILFFIALLLVGIHIYSDYGMSWDEPTQLNLGIKTYRYIVKSDTALLDYFDRWYGSIFELFLVIAQNKTSDQKMFLSRHWLTFLSFFMGCIFFYLLCLKWIKNQWLSLVGTICLVLSPRIFADSFYNSKDIPFLVCYLVNVLSMLFFLEKQNPLQACFHGLLSGALISIRLPGLVIPALTFLGLLVKIAFKKSSFKQALTLLLVYWMVTAVFCVLFWPALWHDPLNGLVSAWKQMSHFPHDTIMLFMGAKISSTDLPWYYIPVWIGITTPIFYIGCFVLGLASLLRLQRTWFRKIYSPQRFEDLMVFLAFILPLAAVIGLRSVLYDGWRQMYFIYPPFLLISLKGIQWVWEKISCTISTKAALVTVVLAIVAGTAPTLFWMVENHPYQNVYFNRFAGKDMETIQQKYMMDYWGLAYREGIEHLVNLDDRAVINVFLETPAGHRAIALLPPEEARRVHVVGDIKDADYFIGNYYLFSAPYPFENEIYSIKVDNAKILSIFKLSTEDRF